MYFKSYKKHLTIQWPERGAEFSKLGVIDVDKRGERVEGEDMLEENDKQNVGVRPAGNGNWCEQDK